MLRTVLASVAVLAMSVGVLAAAEPKKQVQPAKIPSAAVVVKTKAIPQPTKAGKLPKTSVDQKVVAKKPSVKKSGKHFAAK